MHKLNTVPVGRSIRGSNVLSVSLLPLLLLLSPDPSVHKCTSSYALTRSSKREMVRRCILRALFSATSFFKRSGSMLSGGNLREVQVARAVMN